MLNFLEQDDIFRTLKFVTFSPTAVNTDTWFNQNFHLPSANLTLVQKGVFFSGSKIYNQLPLNIKMLYKDIKHFKSSLRTYLMEHVFYSIDEYHQLTS
jgi:hypothetical protein